jgi:transcriptional regulator GlxA family with amidase domain
MVPGRDRRPAWVLEQRVRLAQTLLETDPSMGVEEAAGRAGFSSAALLRQHFQRRFGCSPTEYRSRFAPSSPG